MEGIKVLISLLLFSTCFANAQPLPHEYDSALAIKLGADDNGMKKYVLVLLKPTALVLDKSVRDSLFRGHMENINRLATAGLLVVAGPMGKNDRYSGIFILNAKSIEEGNALVQSDPAVKAGVFDADCYIWYGSAALQETLNIHSRIEKK